MFVTNKRQFDRLHYYNILNGHRQLAVDVWRTDELLIACLLLRCMPHPYPSHGL